MLEFEIYLEEVDEDGSEEVRKLRQVQQWKSGSIYPNMSFRDHKNVLNVSRQTQDLGQFDEEGLGNSHIPEQEFRKISSFLA